MDPGMHRDLEPIAFLLGAWKGLGQDEYPSVQSRQLPAELRREG